MIKEAIKSIKEILTPKSELVEDDIQCAIDDDVVDCTEFKEPYIGVPAPDYLPEDPWFAPPVLSDKQMTIKEAHEQAILDNQILAEGDDGVVESSDIHQKMYEIATKNQSTTLHLDPPGGSENFHEGPGGWMSGTGMSQFK
jgi:hypothetical protein